MQYQEMVSEQRCSDGTSVEPSENTDTANTSRLQRTTRQNAVAGLSSK